MITISSRSVTAISEKQLKISWVIGGSADPGESIKVSRSQSPEGPFTEIADLAVSATQHLDTPNHYYLHREYYYIVKSSDDPEVPDAVKLDYIPDGPAREVARLQTRHLERDVGVLCAVFKKMTSGTRCPDCWDADLDQVTKDNCETCLGTRFEVSYGDQIDAYIQLPRDDIRPTDNRRDGDKDQTSRIATMSNYPIIDRGDVIIEKSMKQMWEVSRKGQVTRRSKRGYIINQRFQADMIPPDNIEKNLLASMT